MTSIPSWNDYSRKSRNSEGRLEGGLRMSAKKRIENPAEKPLFSVVTAVLNNVSGMRHLIQNVQSQTYPGVEHIVIDGGSTDGTVEVLQEQGGSLAYWLSEPDTGIYDAMNKGVAASEGDWIHLLNSDDEYASNDGIERLVAELDPDRFNYCAIDLKKINGEMERLYFPYSRWKLFLSAFLPHPGCVISARQYREHGLYDTSLRIAADHDLILRYTRKMKPKLHDVTLTQMNQGGASAQFLELGCEEFRDVTARHGLPAIAANFIFKYRRRRMLANS